MNAIATVAAPARLERVLAHTGFYLRELRHTARPGALGGDLAAIWRHHLCPMERIAIASAAVMSLDPKTAEELSEATLCDLRVGEPIPPFNTLREEARDWAAFASPGERKAYLAACWNHISEAEQVRFLSAAGSNR